LQRLDLQVCTSLSEEFCGGVSAAAVSRVPPANSIAELERCVNEWVYWVQLESGSVRSETGPTTADRKVLVIRSNEKMVELDVPQWCTSALPVIRISTLPAPQHQCGYDRIHAVHPGGPFKDFPTIRFIIPHGGGAVSLPLGTVSGTGAGYETPALVDMIRNNVSSIRACIIQMGLDLLTKIIPIDNIMLRVEMVGCGARD
jgi:4-oxalmesaconate hydratase